MNRFTTVLCFSIGILLTAFIYADDLASKPKSESRPVDESRTLVSSPEAVNANPTNRPFAKPPLDVASKGETQSGNETKPEPPLTTKQAASAKNSVRQVFQKPSPSNASQDPSVIAALDSTKSLERTLSVIYERFKNISGSFEQQEITNTDLAKVTEQMRPLVKAARSDVTTLLHAAQDLMTELPHTKLSLEATGRLYRQKALSYRDQELRKITETMATQFERLENDIPRKMRLTSDFIIELTEAHLLLAEAERCLNDTATAMQILTAGNNAPKPSQEGIAFQYRVKQYMSVLDEYGKKLANIPEKQESGTPAVSDTRASSIETGQDNLTDTQSKTSAKEKKKDNTETAEAKPIDTRARTTGISRDVLQANTTLRGSYIDPAGELPLQVTVRNRVGNRITGDIIVKTAYGLGYQRFSGTVNGNTFSLHVTYLSGPLMQSPETWQGQIDEELISGTWMTATLDGKFHLHLNKQASGTAISNTVSEMRRYLIQPGIVR